MEKVIDTEKLVNKVYHIDELQTIITDVIKDYVEQVVLMSDEELLYDRDDWMAQSQKYEDDEVVYKAYLRDVDIHSIAIWVEQLRRFKRIQYQKRKLQD